MAYVRVVADDEVMVKVGFDEADDEKRQRILADWRSWLLQRC